MNYIIYRHTSPSGKVYIGSDLLESYKEMEI
jgi:hypothetical protein